MGTMQLFEVLGISEPLEQKENVYGSTIIVLSMNYTALVLFHLVLYTYMYTRVHDE